MIYLFCGLLVVTCLTSLPGYTDAVCDDLDSSACQILIRDNIDVCNDTCLAQLCPRSCNKCPLKCYTCPQVDSPSDCNNSTVCPDETYQCITTEIFTSGFQKAYKLGCAPKSICDNTFGGGRILGRRDGATGGCCSTDLCNSSSTTASDAPSEYVDVPVSEKRDKRQTMSLCSDIHPEACRLFVAANPGACSSSCLASVCESACGRCKQCYKCSHVAKPEDCSHVTTCSKGDNCYTLELLSGDVEHGFRMGCMSDDICTRLASPPTAIGRRAAPGNTFGCCNGSLCNSRVLQPTVKPTTTSGQSSACNYRHCPDGFQVKNGKCVMLSPVGTYLQDKKFCIDHCSRLAEKFTSLSTEYSIINDLVRHLNDTTPVRYVYIGATSMHRTDGKLYWESTNERVRLPTSTSSDHLDHCGIIYARVPVATIYHVECSGTHHGLCEANIK